MKDPNFMSEHNGKTATITLNGKIEQVFPVFGAFEERKWSDGWNPVLVFPTTETIQEGTTFLTNGHGHGEDQFTWIVNQFKPDQFYIQYVVYTENRHWTITVTCTPLSANQTSAAITYLFTGHNGLGNEIDRHMLNKIFSEDLKDWEKAINAYLSKN
jgi:hypothetical protein